jgi:hypothetical protein
MGKDFWRQTHQTWWVDRRTEESSCCLARVRDKGEKKSRHCASIEKSVKCVGGQEGGQISTQFWSLCMSMERTALPPPPCHYYHHCTLSFQREREREEARERVLDLDLPLGSRVG